MEAGVVEYPDGGRYAVAVFVWGDAPRGGLDATVGRAALTAVEHLRDLR
jgi:beta-lactamase class A